MNEGVNEEGDRGSSSSGRLCAYCVAEAETSIKLALDCGSQGGDEIELRIVVVRSPIPVCKDHAVDLWGRRAERVYRAYFNKVEASEVPT